VQADETGIPLARRSPITRKRAIPSLDANRRQTQNRLAINVKPGGGTLNVPREAVFFPKDPIARKPGTKLIVKMH